MEKLDPQDLIQQLTDARERTCALIDQLSDEQLIGPRLPTINPLRWEIGHTAYFYEYWVLRQHYKEPALIDDIDELFDSIHIAHDSRWDLKLPTLQNTIDYMQQVKEKVIAYLSNGQVDEHRDYLVQYAIFHEDMHCEAFTYTRQLLHYPVPKITSAQQQDEYIEEVSGDVSIPGGYFSLGAAPEDLFVFDNEKWAHKQLVEPFKISRLAVTNKDYIEFVQDGGYQSEVFWCEQGWQWCVVNQMQHPTYWRKTNNQGWQIRWFDQWQDIDLNTAVININWYEANAYCRWASRRLPTELEWEVAAAGQPNADGSGLSDTKRYYPWGDQTCQNQHATFNGVTLGPSHVSAKPAGDSAFGCRQMLGNVWEWTSSTFAPYPDFVADMYQDYSQPLFGKTKVLRGGCWASRSRLLRNTWRNYYAPERNDIFAGFRTCALDE